MICEDYTFSKYHRSTIEQFVVSYRSRVKHGLESKLVSRFNNKVPSIFDDEVWISPFLDSPTS